MLPTVDARSRLQCSSSLCFLSSQDGRFLLLLYGHSFSFCLLKYTLVLIRIINFSNCMDSSVEQNKSPVLQIMTGFL